MPKKDLSKEREEECMPIAREILKLIGESSESFILGSANMEDFTAFYQKFVAEKILPLVTAKNIKTAEHTFIMQMVLQPVDFIKNLLAASLEEAENAAVASKFGLKDHRDIRISDIIEAQKEAVE